jgi:hypothetical protein
VTRAPTRSGHFVDLLAPDPAKILLADIAEGLAKLNRWAGATALPLSVAEHSCLVAKLMALADGPTAALYGLLHDAHEYVMGDVTEPARIALGRHIGPALDDALDALRARLDAAIHAAFDLDFPRPRATEQLLWASHARIVATEIRDQMAESFTPADFATEDLAYVQPLGVKLTPAVNWVKADAMYRDAFNRFHAQAGLRKTNAFME